MQIQKLKDMDPIIFTNLPSVNDLSHIYVNIDGNEIKDRSVKSDFQWQVLKTRILLFSDPNIIACPAEGSSSYIHVIVNKEYIKNASLNLLFQKQNLQVLRVDRVEMSVYEACLKYLFSAKLSPMWNSLKNYFIEGKYFLFQKNFCNSVELQLRVEETKLILWVKALRLWLNKVMVQDFDPPSSILENINSREFYLDLSATPYWMYVLPSMKRGRALYVTNCLPINCVFTSYLEIRRHWKNMYGYRLPKTDSSMLYVGINFFGRQIFTYPLPCVRWGYHSNSGSSEIITQFIGAIKKNIHQVCGFTLDMEGNLFYPRDSLNEIRKAQEEVNSDEVNVSLFSYNDEKDNYLINVRTEVSSFNENKSKSPHVSLENSLEIRGDSPTHQYLTGSSISRISVDKLQNEISQTDKTSLATYKPIFNTFQKNHVHKPVFKKSSFMEQEITKENNNNMKQISLPTETSLDANGSFPPIMLNNFHSPPHKPMFVNKKSKINALPIFKSSQNDVDSQSQSTLSNQSSVNLNPTFVYLPSQKYNSNTEKIIEPLDDIISKHKPEMLTQVPLKPIFQKPINKNKPSNLFHLLNKGIKTSSPKDLTRVKQVKEKILMKEKNLKKPYQSALMSGEEIEKMALKGELARVNVSSLMEYLKKRGVRVRAREKKQELIDKILIVLKN